MANRKNSQGVERIDSHEEDDILSALGLEDFNEDEGADQGREGGLASDRSEEQKRLKHQRYQQDRRQTEQNEPLDEDEE